MTPESVLAVLHEAAAAARAAIATTADRRARTERPGQYALDVSADAAVCDVLRAAGFGIVSEESGEQAPDAARIAVVDPVDGSTNAARGLPWYATSIAVVDSAGPFVASVVNLATGVHYDAVRGQGATRDGRPIGPSSCTSLDRAVLGVNGWPARHLGWRQMRSLGAASLELCSVAEGALDAYLACTDDEHGPWDYMAGVLICREAGAFAADVDGRDLTVRDPATRRSLAAAASQALLDDILRSRSLMD